jgi:hypothetical protein
MALKNYLIWNKNCNIVSNIQAEHVVVKMILLVYDKRLETLEDMLHHNFLIHALL